MVTGEDISMSSWSYGDPAPPILRAYAGDPAKIRLVHGGVKETHVFHLHNHQWRLEPDDPKSTIIDSISIGPQECYTLDILYGARSLTGTIGDVIFHCDLYPHFHEGMWTLLRIFDRLEDGCGKYTDETPENYLDKVNCGKIRPEPLVIRANAGDCIEVRRPICCRNFLMKVPSRWKRKRISWGITFIWSNLTPLFRTEPQTVGTTLPVQENMKH